MTTRDLALDPTRAHAHTGTDVVLGMDEESFRGFYDRTARMLWAYLYRITGDRHAADDLLQEAYYRLLRANVTIETEAHRRHYLFRVATNLARDRYRRQQVHPPCLSQEAAAELKTPTDTGEALLTRIDLSRAFSRLGVRERALLWLAYGHGSSHEEIAATVGVTPGSVKALLYRARRRLASFLDDGGRS